jgi:hypothetical protein
MKRFGFVQSGHHHHDHFIKMELVLAMIAGKFLILALSNNHSFIRYPKEIIWNRSCL